MLDLINIYSSVITHVTTTIGTMIGTSVRSVSGCGESARRAGRRLLDAGRDRRLLLRFRVRHLHRHHAHAGSDGDTGTDETREGENGHGHVHRLRARHLVRLLVELGLSSDEDDEIMNARASPSVHRSFRIDASIFSRATGTLAVRRQPSRFFARVVSSSSRVTLIPARGTLATGRRRRRKRIATSRAHP